jgi:hypothetical protein
MNATIQRHASTDTYTVRVYRTDGSEILSNWCGSYATAERIARQYECSVTNI